LHIIPRGLRAFEASDADFFLQLLPGPRDRDGVPESLRFWKLRLEETDPDRTFRVGVLYGPSGCGKSSLVRAGLLPRLAGSLLTLYVEATPNETEVRLLRALRKRCPSVPVDHGLVETLAGLRRGSGLPAGKKVVLVLDQFEQWLHARAGDLGAELIQALRHCDGEHVQAVLLVRDDFWMALTRCMRELEVPLVEGHNSAAVDLFDLRHARRVLTAFGRAFGALPEGAVSSDHERFLDRALAGLAQNDKVISVRLSLFAEMVKSKQWTPATLKEVGGPEGVGVAFLEETFSAPTAPPEHRLHQRAARAVLRALLPEEGANLKGHMRARQELQAASGYGQRPREFDELLRILDTEVRLVTPTEAEGAEAAEAPESQPGGLEQYYQLTHDYLVSALRQWLTRKKKETWRGRAELRLEERAAQWTPTHRSRLLPSLPEFLVFWLGVPRRRQKPQERALMRAARRHHGLRWGLALVVLLVAGIGLQQYMAVVRRERMGTLVETVLNATPEGLPSAIETLQPFGDLAVPLLRTRFVGAPVGSLQQLHAALALAELGEVQTGFLIECIPIVPASEARHLIRALGRARESVAPELLRRSKTEAEPESRARYAITLLHLGNSRGAESDLAFAPDPTYRTAFIHTFPAWHGVLENLANFLENSKEEGFQSGLCASLGLMPVSTFGDDERQALAAALTRLYRSASDGGTHSAAGWALRQWQVALPALAVSSGSVPGRRWFLNGQGMTMCQMDAGTFVMGDPELPATRPHRVKLRQTRFICDREVWQDLFKLFANDPGYPAEAKPVKWKATSGASDRGLCPVNGVCWGDAIRFCNWLSWKEERRPCYVPRKVQSRTPDAALDPDAWDYDPHANGYRLPTEAEWEYACRAGSTTAYSFGNSAERLASYAWFLKNSNGRFQPGGSLLPNDWGLFDMHGNLAEWCWDRHGRQDAKDQSDPLGPEVGTDRITRGGSCLVPDPRLLRSGWHDAKSPPRLALPHVTFRVVCSVPL
jgi:formylglycine-generating enzyme required for sulfatase activity